MRCSIISSTARRTHDGATNQFGNLRDDTVSEGSQAVHSLGYPMSHSTHKGLRAPGVGRMLMDLAPKQRVHRHIGAGLRGAILPVAAGRGRPHLNCRLQIVATVPALPSRSRSSNSHAASATSLRIPDASSSTAPADWPPPLAWPIIQTRSRR